MPDLKQFYRDYLEWINSPANNNPDWSNPVKDNNNYGFSIHVGLCYALQSWCYMKDISPIESLSLKMEMKDQFSKAGLNQAYPFGGQECYVIESYGGSCHLNKERIAWVEEHAK